MGILYSTLTYVHCVCVSPLFSLLNIFNLIYFLNDLRYALKATLEGALSRGAHVVDVGTMTLQEMRAVVKAYVISIQYSVFSIQYSVGSRQ